MCLDERRVSRVDLSSRRITCRNSARQVCCCDVQGHSNDEGMSLVLASLSSAFLYLYFKDL